MIEKHQDPIPLGHKFSEVYRNLQSDGSIQLATSRGTIFTAAASTSRDGRKVIRIFQKGNEYARAYECCWGHYYNCNRTRIGMYCKAIDHAMSK